jgi:NAD(P)H-dependent FMN reductase
MIWLVADVCSCASIWCGRIERSRRPCYPAVIRMAFEKRIQIAGVCGSLREGSYTKMALTIALKGAESPICETDLIDLRDFDLVFADGTGTRELILPDVERFRVRLRKADGVIIGTPEYHGSFTGVLKNALDLTGFAEWEGKMIALVGVSGGRLGAHNALNSLRDIGRSLHAWVIPEQASIPEAYKYFDAMGNLKDRALAERLHEVGRQVARFTYLHKCAAAHDFLADWEKAQPNPGATSRPGGAG